MNDINLTNYKALLDGYAELRVQENAITALAHNNRNLVQNAGKVTGGL